MPTATPIKLDTNDNLRITNTGTKTISFVLGRSNPGGERRRWVVEPGQFVSVPFDVVRIYFGDPRSIVGSPKRFKDSKEEGIIPDRVEELRRLATLYGLYDQGLETLPQRAPNCRIETFDGDEIITPIVDPHGEFSLGNTGLTSSDIKNMTDMTALIARHEKQLDEMRSMMDTMRKNGANIDEEVQVDDDDD